MKTLKVNSINVLILCTLAFFMSNITNAQDVNQGFETSSCSNLSQAFYTGCIPNWINVSGSADVSSNYSGISPYEGSRYAHMYSQYHGFYCSSTPTRGESVALNYNFQAGETYTINYAIQWRESGSCHSLETKWVLTNGKNNQIGGSNGCPTGEILPSSSGSDQVIKTHNMVGNQTSWQTHSVTFTPSSNYTQLWIRPETKVNWGCSSSSEALNRIYLDAFELETCPKSGYSTNFYLWASSNMSGNVTANTYAYSNPVYVNHWWDVFYAPGGNTSGNSQVPGNSIQCCSSFSSTFSNNLYINQWYYIKHGIWNDCISWRETRKRFRVSIGKSRENGEPEYRIEIEDVDFEPTEEYLKSMEEMVAGLTPEEIELHNQNELNFVFESESAVNSISNRPNPFNTTTTIEFAIEKEQDITLQVYDISGKPIATLLNNETILSGKHQVEFNGTNLPKGIYFYTIQAEGFRETQRMILK